MLAMLKGLGSMCNLTNEWGKSQKQLGSFFSRLPMSCYKVTVEVGMEGDCSESLGQQRALGKSHNGCP